MHNVNIGGKLVPLWGISFLLPERRYRAFVYIRILYLLAAYSKSKFCLTTRHFLMLTFTCMDASALSSGSVGSL